MGKGWNLHVQAIVRDEELIERMRDTAQMFWEKTGEKGGGLEKVEVLISYFKKERLETLGFKPFFVQKVAL